MGRIEILAHSIAFMAGYDLRLVTIVQSLAQLIGVYGEHAARTLIANHACRVVFAPNELRDARDISETLGMTTIKSEQASHGASGASGASRRFITKRYIEQQRALLLPQELRTLGAERELILISDHAPILAEKIRYFDDPVFKKRVRPLATLPTQRATSCPSFAVPRSSNADPSAPDQVPGQISSE